MTGKILLTALSVLLPFVVGCESGAPVSPPNDPPSFVAADGNGNKFVVHIDGVEFDGPNVCPDGTELDIVIDGWFQGRSFEQDKNKNVVLTVFRLTWTFTNSVSDETFAFQEVGPDRVYMEDGKFFVAITGRIPFLGLIGHAVFDLSTDPPTPVFTAGRNFGDLLLLACEDLT